MRDSRRLLRMECSELTDTSKRGWTAVVEEEEEELVVVMVMPSMESWESPSSLSKERPENMRESDPRLPCGGCGFWVMVIGGGGPTEAC